MGLTVMVNAESSQSISFSFPESWSRMVRWWAARIRKTPRMIMKTRKLMHTTITTVAVLGTTGEKQRSEEVKLGFNWRTGKHSNAFIYLLTCSGEGVSGANDLGRADFTGTG